MAHSPILRFPPLEGAEVPKQLPLHPMNTAAVVEGSLGNSACPEVGLLKFVLAILLMQTQAPPCWAMQPDMKDRI